MNKSCTSTVRGLQPHLETRGIEISSLVLSSKLEKRTKKVFEENRIPPSGLSPEKPSKSAVSGRLAGVEKIMYIASLG